MNSNKNKTNASRVNEKLFVDVESDSNSEDAAFTTTASRRQSYAQRNNALSPLVTPSTSETSTSTARSLTSSIGRFRTEFEEFKCKMKIFGESLELCKCIASDFKNKFSMMEKRLRNLERRQVNDISHSNYTDIIKKNKALSHKTKMDAKKLQMCGTEDEMRSVAARICRNYLHGAWKTVDAQDLYFRRISGGLSNFLYHVALPEDPAKLKGAGYRERDGEVEEKLSPTTSYMLEEPKKVLLRIYGQVHGERAMDAIVTESVIFTLLSERRLGPKLYGVFSGGRIEEYIPARSLKTRELAEPAMSMKIAEKMAAIHAMDVPLSKEPTWLWKSFAKWIKVIKEERLADTSKANNDMEKQIIRRLKTIDYEREVDWLRKVLAAVDSPVVFCHNDMQEGNVLLLEDEVQNTNDDYAQTYSPRESRESPDVHDMRQSLDETEHQSRRGSVRNEADIVPSTASLNKIRDAIEDRATYMEVLETNEDSLSHLSDSGEPRLVLIDFEYCAYNYRGFDIANHFQEWIFDYTNEKHPFYFENDENYPTLEQKEIFIKEYLKHYNANLSSDKDTTPSIDAVNKLLNEVDAFALASHLFWCCWSIVNASKSQIPFGYWEYALSRLDIYLQLKQEILKDEGTRASKRKICEVDI